jgi:pre-rRNA-processing protein TSR4
MWRCPLQERSQTDCGVRKTYVSRAQSVGRINDTGWTHDCHHIPCIGTSEAPANGDENDPFADDADFTLSQKDLNDALGTSGNQDKHYVRFLTRVELAKDQVLRYARWQEQSVLWVHSGYTIEHGAVPPCDRCRSPRKFEFQVLPQLLFYLQVDQSSSLSEIAQKSCEWGTLVAYTCSQSCALSGEAADEFLHYQPPYAGA